MKKNTITKTFLITGLLSLLGFMANMLALPLAFGVAFIFGSIFSIIAIRILGTWWGVAVAVAASSYTFILWNHPYAIIIFAVEAAWIGVALKRGRANILLIDSVYWLLLGTPLVILFYAGVMHLGVQSTAIIVLKQSLNGILNSLIAGILLAHTPVGRWRSSSSNQIQPFSTRIFHLVAASLMFPLLGFLAYTNYHEITDMQQRVAREISSEVRETEEMLAHWIEEHINAARIIAELGSNYPLSPSSRLQEDLQQIHKLFPDFHNVFLGNSGATTVAFHPTVNEKGESTIGINFADRAWFKELNGTLQPVISDIFMGRGGVFAPIFSISVPVIKNGTLHHFGLGAINLDRMKALFKRAGERKDIYYTVIDRNSNVVISSFPGRKPLERYEDKGTSHTLISSDVYLRVPDNQKNISVMQVWKGASYYTKVPVRGTSWTLLLEYPVAPLQNYLYGSTIWSLGIVATILLIMITIASIVSRKLTKSLQALAQISKDIPERVDNKKTILWPISPIQELTELTENFSQTADALSNRIVQVQEINQQLEQKVELRTVELKGQQQRLANIIYGTNVGTWEWNIQTGETIFNQQWATIIGYSLEELEPTSIKTWLDLAHEDDLTVSGELLEKHFKGESEGYECECRMRHKDGHWVWVLDRGKVVSWTDDGKPLLMSGTHQDISARKLAEEVLRETEARYRALFTRAGDGIFIMSTDGRVIEVNDSFALMHGYSTEEMRQIDLKDIDTPETARLIPERMGKLLTGEALTFEVEHYHKDGHIFPLEVSASLISSGGESYIQCFHRDITGRKQVEEQLFKAKVAAESANRAKSEFLANMSHEIRTPMNGVLGMTQLLEMTDLTEEQQQYVSTLKLSGNNLLSLINDILDLSKIEAGKTTLELSTFSLIQSIKDIVTIENQVIRQKGLILDANLPEDIPAYLLGDQLRVKQILLNLIGNAIKFTTQGGITISAQLLEQHDDSALVQIAVRDTGVGISPEAIDKIFEPFVQEDGSISRKYGGTGLGLSISRRLVELMGGSISIESTLGTGSCFTLTLPFSVVKGGSISQESMITRISWDGPPLRVLLAEDDEINTKFGTSLLRKLGLDVIAVQNGKECLTTLAQGDFDLVLMDIQMPVMSGSDALKEIRAMKKETSLQLPVIALTAYSLRGDKERFMEEGFDGYLSKPLETRQLMREMKRVLGIVDETAKDVNGELHG